MDHRQPLTRRLQRMARRARDAARARGPAVTAAPDHPSPARAEPPTPGGAPPGSTDEELRALRGELAQELARLARAGGEGRRR